MEDNKAPKLWNESVEAPKQLRLPKAASNTIQITKEESKPVSKSVLSADAPEWFPASYQAPNQATSTPSVSANTYSVQNRLKKFKSKDNSISEVCNSFSDLNTEDYCSAANSPDVNRLRQIINTLTNDPGQFDDLLEIFTDTLCPYFDDPLILCTAADLLVNQAISNMNFRYTAARLCCHIEQLCPEFRATLHLKCKKELDKETTNKPGLLLFVAELYTQLHHENVYGSYLIDAFKQLLSEGGNDNVKCICQALKLTGSSLELYNKQALDDVFDQLQTIRSTVSGNTPFLLDSVFDLRNGQWGQAASPYENTSDQEQDYVWGDSSSLYYVGDGYRFTQEENEFLAANMHLNEDCILDSNDSDPDELCDPEPEMDEEIQAAFKEFVEYSKR